MEIFQIIEFHKTVMKKNIIRDSNVVIVSDVTIMLITTDTVMCMVATETQRPCMS